MKKKRVRERKDEVRLVLVLWERKEQCLDIFPSSRLPPAPLPFAIGMYEVSVDGFISFPSLSLPPRLLSFPHEPPVRHSEMPDGEGQAMLCRHSREGEDCRRRFEVTKVLAFVFGISVVCNGARNQNGNRALTAKLHCIEINDNVITPSEAMGMIGYDCCFDEYDAHCYDSQN